jgi:hypothetical protein
MLFVLPIKCSDWYAHHNSTGKSQRGFATEKENLILGRYLLPNEPTCFVCTYICTYVRHG